ncbi:MAG TPA: hypothetical protein VLB81_13490 [Gaiellales bacterium]|nr:hypothetical protein [Gaiellales bacterium]
MHVRTLAALLATAALAAGCGQAAGGGAGSGGSTQPPPSTEPATVKITGILVATTSAHTGAGSPQSGVRIGIYTRPISNEGPIMADPPEPIATVMTDADGRFAFELPGTHNRYFVSAIDARGYAPGRWAKPGIPVRLTACTDCAIPL